MRGATVAPAETVAAPADHVAIPSLSERLDGAPIASRRARARSGRRVG
uniref:Uncharacterized protein n=1 Tax=Arundo donax TaxID=35708 RepID=A0A0A9ARX8_ARUDO